MYRILLLLVGLVRLNAFGQDPSIQWQNTIGGDNWEIFTTLINTTDGGYLLGCMSDSDISWDKTENSEGEFDFWVIKIKENGVLDWQNTIGGNESDRLRQAFQTQDGGYILGGDSESNASGDKTENSRGEFDYWIVKIDQSGQVEWDITLGGDGHDVLTSIIQNDSGEFLLTGLAWSNISGDKTENNVGLSDIWTLKLSNSGEIIWQNTIGGSDLDTPTEIIEAIDGGYIIAGSSDSDISGDKTENSEGDRDYWVFKINEGGDIIWQNTIGGMDHDTTSAIISVGNSGYLIGGASNSSISGDKEENSNGFQDYWIVKLDINGVIEWQNTIGGNNTDVISKLVYMEDVGFLVLGWSLSSISGDKEEDSQDIDYWLVQINLQGVITHQNTFNAEDVDFTGGIAIDGNGDYLLAGSSRSEISGDKEEGLLGGQDLWILKLSSFLAINEYATQDALKVYPNPSTSNFFIENLEQEQYISIKIIDLLGREIKLFEKGPSDPNREFDISSLKPGLYFIEILTPKFKVTKQLIKK